MEQLKFIDIVIKDLNDKNPNWDKKDLLRKFLTTKINNIPQIENTMANTIAGKLAIRAFSFSGLSSLTPIPSKVLADIKLLQ